MKLEQICEKIEPLDKEAMQRAVQHWNSIAKPLHSLGKLEDVIVQIAGIQRIEQIDIDKNP